MMPCKRKLKTTELSSRKLNLGEPVIMEKPLCGSRALRIAVPMTLVAVIVFVLFQIDLSAFYIKFSSLKETLYESTSTPSKADSTGYRGLYTMLQVNRSTGWVQFPVIPNETELRIRQIEANGTSPCHEVRTHTGRVSGLPSPEKQGDPIRLLAGPVYEFWIISEAENGSRRCTGGDFYETDLSGSWWKSRPPIVDYGDGSYQVQMQVDPRFSGLYRLRINLLYANFHGLHLLVVDNMSPWIRYDEVYSVMIEFFEPTAPPPPFRSGNLLPRCGADDYRLKQWSGRWTRTKFNSSCRVDKAGRFICLPHDTPCDEPWCQGPLDVLESNGWVYSAHCSFKLFTQDEAWQCLDGKWLFWWGDSNHLDTGRNLLSFVLGLPNMPPRLERRTDKEFVRPGNFTSRKQSVRMTNIFNGHWHLKQNYLGLYSLTNPGFKTLLKSYFKGARTPDVMIMNSGLHDGCYWPSATQYVKQGLDLAIKFWTGVLDGILPKTPRFIYRTTIAAGAKARARGFNPHKMEIFNTFMVEKLQNASIPNMRIVDGYDLTFPWHYNNDANDGAHYGKAPSRAVWVNGKIGHQYFVDLMLVHMLLNAICDESSESEESINLQSKESKPE
ncbi:hypothetical protein R1sor_006713 [Riccia sorocarpa]|uniref:Uncharacterized protein n=1 Tax=Riccia sorocarpa TaxID=122646 RepID=A0ABD3HNC4_9MARC